MLSFLKEQSAGKPENNENAADVSSQSESKQDYLKPSANEKTVKQTTMLLMVLFTVGAGALWFMIKKTVPAEADAATAPKEQMEIETALAQLTGIKDEMNKNMGQIVDRFHQFSDIEQISVSELKKNPFKNELLLDQVTAAKETNSDFEQSKAKIVTEKVNEQAEQLKLWSIMESPKGSCCMINEKILYEGDSINGFEVKKITSESVELESQEVPVTLRMPK
ncbi:hypothetical protein STSP2_02765 [Anaerohalosphaera lusitana]|uniref:Uncharacterized protein n=1 Tax=Anaerohalosphaera lusitana TaxID=1936003 RepID=A0A1U9NNP5_9BACT|nr:hypothetical protein [Anaerohalosphaera lusitana]AQT69572.1 hypothetical protein STSP2_02765 [Anaerohalosphaera lusitana]